MGRYEFLCDDCKKQMKGLGPGEIVYLCARCSDISQQFRKQEMGDEMDKLRQRVKELEKQVWNLIEENQRIIKDNNNLERENDELNLEVSRLMRAHADSAEAAKDATYEAMEDAERGK